MNQIESLIFLHAAAALFAQLARLLKVPYPILLVVGGLALGFVPGLPEVEIPPEVIFLVFLPPLLNSAAFSSSPLDLRAQLRLIVLLAVGLVLATMGAVAVIAHALIGLAWAAAFVLGAILAPHRSRGGRGDLRQVGRAGARGYGRRGREPRERWYRPGRLPGRRRGGGQRRFLGVGSGSEFPAGRRERVVPRSRPRLVHLAAAGPAEGPFDLDHLFRPDPLRGLHPRRGGLARLGHPGRRHLWPLPGVEVTEAFPECLDEVADRRVLGSAGLLARGAAPHPGRPAAPLDLS